MTEGHKHDLGYKCSGEIWTIKCIFEFSPSHQTRIPYKTNSLMWICGCMNTCIFDPIIWATHRLETVSFKRSCLCNNSVVLYLYLSPCCLCYDNCLPMKHCVYRSWHKMTSILPYIYQLFILSIQLHPM